MRVAISKKEGVPSDEVENHTVAVHMAVCVVAVLRYRNKQHYTG